MSNLLPSLWGNDDNPFTSLQKEMDRMFQDFGRKLPTAGAPVTSFPAIDVHDTDKGLELTAELPGIAEKDIDVSVSDRTLTIKGEKTAEKTVDEKDRYVSERSYGSFRRVLTLPCEPDAAKVEAHMDNGVLTVVLPRPAETTEKTKKIEVKRKG